MNFSDEGIYISDIDGGSHLSHIIPFSVSKEETEHFFKINFKKLLTLFKNFVILYMKFDIFLYI